MTVDQWLAEYGESHQNPVNKCIHWVCVPVITVTLFALLSLVPWPWEGTGTSAAHVFLAAVLVFYFRLSVSLGWGMTVVGALSLVAVHGLSLLPFPLLTTSLVLFVIAWVAQFIGHTIEGKKPSFARDVQFLLIGPLWLTAHLYRKWHLPY